MSHQSESGGFRSGGIARLGRIAISVFVVGAGFAAGCGESDRKAEIALASSGRLMAALNASGDTPAGEPSRAKVYKKVIEQLQPVTTQGSPAQQAAARRMVASAQSGQAQIDASQASALADEALELMGQASAVFDRRVGQLALASAMSRYDPSSERAAITKEEGEKQVAIGEIAKKRSEAEKGLAALRTRANAFAETAKGLRGQESELRAKSLQAAPGERVGVVEQAVAMQRKADEAEMQAALLEAQAARQAPDLEAMGRESDRLKKQEEFLAIALKEIDARESAGKEQSAENSRQAEEAGKELDALMGEIDQRMHGDLSTQLDNAVKSFETASRTLKGQSGGGDDRTSLQLGSARIQQGLGDVLRARAFVWDTYGALLTRLAEGKPALANAPQYSKNAESATAQAKESFAAANEAFGRAGEALASAGGKGDMAERLQRAADQLNKLKGGAEAGGDAKPGETDSASAGAKPGAEDGAAPTAPRPGAEPPVDSAAHGETEKPAGAGAGGGL